MSKKKSFRKFNDHCEEVIEGTRRNFKGRDNKRYDGTKRRVQEERRRKSKDRNTFFDGE